MSIWNDTECADVGGECRYVNEMNINHFLTIAGVVLFLVFLIVLSYLQYVFIMIFSYCRLGTYISHYQKLPRSTIDIGRYRLSKVY